MFMYVLTLSTELKIVGFAIIGMHIDFVPLFFKQGYI